MPNLQAVSRARHTHHAQGHPTHVERLEDRDRPRLLQHFLGLSGDDIRLRFGRSMTEEALETYVGTLDLDGSESFVATEESGAVLAVVQGFAFESEGCKRLEVAFSTAPRWRRRGLATRLLQSIVAEAARTGVAEIVAQCEVRNAAMRSVMHTTGASTNVDDGEVSAKWPMQSTRRGPDRRVRRTTVTLLDDELRERRVESRRACIAAGPRNGGAPGRI